MRSSQEELLARWLAAERADRQDEAEAALLGVCAMLPPLAPPAGFADRVLLRARLGAAPVPAPAAQPSLFASWWMRALALLGLLSMGASALWLPQTLRALAGLWSLGGMVRVWTGSLVGACRWLSSAFGLWELFLTIGRALAAPLETPAMALAMATCLLVSMAAFGVLRSLISRNRSWIHETV
jgi:hypothetical protein